MADSILTPQQQKFLQAYTDPKSPTFSNAMQSGLEAGYDDAYAKNILNQLPEWLKSNLEKSRLIIKAERNLELALEGMLDDAEKGKKEIQWKATDFTLSRLRKDVYSERQEVTGKDGKDLPTPIVNIIRDEIPSNNSNG